MTCYRTCQGCLFAKAPCAERAKLSKKIAGLRLTSVKFKCSWRRPEFRPGEAVRIRVQGSDPHAEYGVFIENVDGYFVSDTSDGSKVLVFVSPADFAAVIGDEMRNNGYMRLSRSYVTRREGAPASFCSECGNLSAISGHNEWCKHHPDAEKFARQWA